MDATYEQFCTTEEQRKTIRKVIELGSSAKAAKALGKDRRTVDRIVLRVKKNAQLKGYSPEHGQRADLMPIETLSGRSFQKKDENGNLTWYKTKVDEERRIALIEEWVDRLCEDVKPLPPVSSPKSKNDDLLAVIPMGDPHFGMYAWAEEAGDHFDLATADRLTRAAIDRAVMLSPPAANSLLINLGDFFHADNTTNRTPASGHALDVDTRFDKIMQVAEDCLVYCIRRMLEKFGTVTFWSMPGNHDPHCGSPLSRILRAYFRDNPRVIIDVRPGKFNYMRFGKVLIGATHGDQAKPAQLPLIMATDKNKEWGETEFRYWYVGHVHHKDTKEYPGCITETFRTVASRDAWHAAMGLRAGRDINVIIHHKDFGEVVRARCDLALIESKRKPKLAVLA